MSKTFLFLTAVSALMLTTGCSNEDVNLLPQTDSDRNEVDMISTPVEIRLGIPAVSVTRAALDDNTQDINLGVFCLARASQSATATSQPSWWNTDVEWEKRSSFCLLNNVKANKSGNNVSWVDGETRFYPYRQSYSYDFYAYYPYVEFKSNTNLIDTTQVGKVRVYYKDLDGKTDILWGRETNADPTAYSARYFCQPIHVSEVPKIQLDHMLTRLRFWVVPDEDAPGAGTYDNAQGAKVVSLKVINAVKNVTLLLADENDRNNTKGSRDLTFQGTDEPGRLSATDDETTTLWLCGADGNPISSVSVPATPLEKVQVGESLLLFPAQQYTLQITLEKGGVKYLVDHEFVLSHPTGKFAAGEVYDITLTVKGLSSVSAKADISAWQTPDLTDEQKNSMNQAF